MKGRIFLPGKGDGLFADVRAVLFDLDGTLVDSMGMWGEIDRSYLGRFGIPVPEKFQQSIEGKSIRETADYYREAFPSIPHSQEEMIEEWHRMAFSWYAEKSELKPGAYEFIRFCREAGLLLGIATSNSTPLLNAALAHMAVGDYFSSLKTGDIHLPGKPAPDIYLACAKELAVLPENCLVFEDVPKGILAGKAAGMRVIAVDDHDSPEVREEKVSLADAYIQDFKELLFR